MILTVRAYARLVADDERMPDDVREALAAGTEIQFGLESHEAESYHWMACVLLKEKPWTVSEGALDNWFNATRQAFSNFSVLQAAQCLNIMRRTTTGLNGFRDAIINHWVRGVDIDFDCHKYRDAIFSKLGPDVFVNDTAMRRFADAIHPDFRAVLTCPEARQRHIERVTKPKPRAARRKATEPVITIDSDVEDEAADTEDDGGDDEDYKPQRKTRRK